MKFKNKLWVVLFALFALVVGPRDILAQSKYLNYKTIYDSYDVEFNENLVLNSVGFKNNSKDSSLSFGVSGVFNNLSSKDFNVKCTINYYDKSYELIAKSDNTFVALANKKIDFNQMSNINIINDGLSVDDIYYYNINFDYEEVYSSVGVDYSPSLISGYKSLDYVIDGYDINVSVNENNTLDITETIKVYFNKSKHGIYRKIPLYNVVERLDGTTSKNRSYIKNVKINDKYSTSTENSYKVFKIGDADKTVKGSKEYVISYTYDLGRDVSDNYDELYFNLIGNEWDTVIGNVTFTVIMPKDFDSSKLGFSSGSKGSTNNSNIKFSVSNNIITGSYEGILGVGEGLTIRAELDEGYFINSGYQVNWLTYVLFLIPIGCFIVSFIIWNKYGKNDKVVETIEFYPPEGLNSLDVGFWYKGKVNNKDVTSLLIYLANKGYIKIVDNNNEFTIIKLKDYDGGNAEERLFFEGLFETKVNNKSLSSLLLKNSRNGNNLNVTQNVEYVTSSDLYDSFYVTMNWILNRKNKDTIYESSLVGKKVIIFMMILLTVLAVFMIPTYQFFGVSELASVFMLLLIYIPFYMVGLSNIDAKVFKIVWLGLTMFHSIFVFIVLPIASVIKEEIILLIAFIIGICSVVGMIILFKHMLKRTNKANMLFGKIKGFKTFLETAEKERLEMFVEDNPSYFYDILPYTYVLGVSDKWIKKFEAINLQAPNWFESQNVFNYEMFNSSLNRTMNLAKDVMSSGINNSSSGCSSSGGSSGGGFSGGGSGGGGGGSW